MSGEHISSDELRGMVREALAELMRSEERPYADRPELVRIENDADLARFVADLIERLSDPVRGPALRAGHSRFTLARPIAVAVGINPPHRSVTSIHEPMKEAAPLTGLITERRLRGIARGARLVLATGAIVTPLARDVARSLGVTFDRRDS